MKYSTTVFIIFFTLLSVNSFSQSKKEVKKFKIKSSTTVVTESLEGKEKTRTDSYQKFDNSGNVLEEIEYNKDGSFKKKETHKYNRNNDNTEDVIFDEKGNVQKKTITEYNMNKDKTHESVYDGSGKLIEKTQHGYNAKGLRSYENTTDDKGKMIKKSMYAYDKNGLKTEKKPIKCEALNTGALSIKIRFWSRVPPLTLNPEAPSPTLATPGNEKRLLIMSNSPKSVGNFLIFLILKFVTPVSKRFTF